MKIDGYSDSQLVRSQHHGDYEATHPAMIKYLWVVKFEAGTLDEFHISQVLRSENNQEDALLILASLQLAPWSVFWEVMKKQSIKEDPISVLDRSLTWMDGIRA